MKQIVIVGGGFAGVRTARKLSRLKSVSVTLVNDGPDFRYCPALYRAATGFKLGTARLPLEWMLLDSANTDLVIGRAKTINMQKKYIELDDSTKLQYDYAVLALGSVTTYFNIEGLHEHAFGIKTAEEVTELRRHLHQSLTEKSHIERNYVIVGAGPSGVELAGALGTYLQRITKKHRIKKHGIKIWLIEAAPRILPQMNPRASKSTTKHLTKLGVKVAVNTTVKSETIKSLKTSAGNIITHTVIWTAGTSNNEFFKNNADQFSFSERNRIVVDSHLQARPDVYVIGDNAATKYSGTALTAVWHGNFTGKDIIARITHKRRPVKYESHPITVVPAGKNWAVMQYRGIVLHGRPISWLRKAADFVGYSDVLGILRAMTVWTNSEKPETPCSTCRR